jgi:hypothetical protein
LDEREAAVAQQRDETVEIALREDRRTERDDPAGVDENGIELGVIAGEMTSLEGGEECKLPVRSRVPCQPHDEGDRATVR